MIETEPSLVLSLLTIAAVAYFVADLVPRVDALDRSYRKFLALTTLGVTYLLLLPVMLTILTEVDAGEPIGQVLAIAVAAHVLFGLTLLYDVFDDWIRMFADPEYKTWVEASLVLAVVVLLAVLFLLSP
ncbi:hypothetical protein [Halovivax gelatinilyticus]|uniref:hypothetical protein n=1 Tax=Halovivax gelatinilyticus TaxID=2961597 RepID=UPI0020CA7055|nr:hypothetical protein [Halovivax gelatinilyticus]